MRGASGQDKQLNLEKNSEFGGDETFPITIPLSTPPKWHWQPATSTTLIALKTRSLAGTWNRKGLQFLRKPLSQKLPLFYLSRRSLEKTHLYKRLLAIWLTSELNSVEKALSKGMCKKKKKNNQQLLNTATA